MHGLNIYINGENRYSVYPILDYVENTSENDVSLFFLAKKYPNLPSHSNVMVFDFPVEITDEWLTVICNFALKIDAAFVRIHSEIQYSEKINFPLLNELKKHFNNRSSISMFLYETNFNDVILRQEYNGLLRDGLKWKQYARQLKNKILSGDDQWNMVYNYLFHELVNTKYFVSDFHRNKKHDFFSDNKFQYFNEYFSDCNRETIQKIFSIIGSDNNIIDTIRDVFNNNKTLLFIDDGIEHPLGQESKDECILHEIQNGNFEFVFLMNYNGSLVNNSNWSMNVFALPENITLEVLLIAGIIPSSIFCFCSADLIFNKKENVRKIFFHDGKNVPDNKRLCHYLAENNYNKSNILFIDETKKRLRKGHASKQIFILAESMGDVLFAAGGMNALKGKLSGPFVCIIPKIYHSLLSLCPWVDEIWLIDEISKAQSEDIYLARQLGNLHVPSYLKHIIDEKHQIDSFLDFLGYKDISADRKEIVLCLEHLDKTKVDAFLKVNGLSSKVALIHPNVGVPNRTWPQSSWDELVEHFLQDGWSVVLIGSNNNFYSHKKTVEIENSRVFNAVDKFTIAETTYLMTKASLLIACDSGPVALAAATDIAICALYSVVPGKYRLPYRHGLLGWNSLAVNIPCEHDHCARSYTPDSGETFDAWCPKNKSYSCMKEYTSADYYREIIQFLRSDKFIEQCPG